jgi:small subunit ribosomal protein S20
LKEVKVLANIKSALKRINVTRFKTRRNKIIISSLKTSIRRFEEAVKAGNLDEAKVLYQKAASMIDRAVAKGSLHKNTAARKKSRLAKKMKPAA